MNTLMKKYAVFLMVLTLASCNTETKEAAIPSHIGLIAFDPQIDTLGFKVCNENMMYPYFHHKNLSFKGEKPAMVRHYERHFTPVNESENGYVTIRFVVNCDGEAGRFRVIQMDESYQHKSFSDGLASQLLTLTASLEGWDILTEEGTSYDYVRYLTFKIQQGNVTALLP